MAHDAEFPLIDGGAPAVSRLIGLAHRFHYWCGASGRRYLFTSVTANELADFRDAIVVLAEPDGAGGMVGHTVSILGDGSDDDRRAIARALRLDPRLVAFIHLLAPTEAQRRAALDDLLGRSASRSLAA
jgi:hypothetical protein